MSSITATGSVANIRASVTFPQGFDVNDWCDDGDPFDIPSVVTGDDASNINGQRVFWSVANVKDVTMGVIPGSPSDRKLRDLLTFNDPAGGKGVTGDIIEMTLTFPNGTFTQFFKGSIKGGPPANSATSAGRLKSKFYIFGFESATGTA